MADRIERLVERWLPIPAKYEPPPLNLPQLHTPYQLRKKAPRKEPLIIADDIPLVRPYVLASEVARCDCR